MGFLRYAYLSHFSKPASDRCLYRAIKKGRCRRIVELGIGQANRTKRMLDLASAIANGETVHFTGVDLFEARPSDAAGLTLKRAHRVLTADKVKLRLLPGDPFSALARAANALTNSDLIVISADQGPDSVAKAWFYLPRMLHERSYVFVEEYRDSGVETRFRRLNRTEIDRLAASAAGSNRVAA